MARKFAAAAFWAGCLHSSGSLALGLGELKLESFLNEPLRARVDLLDTAGLQPDQIRVRLATQDDFDRLGVDRAYFLTGISFRVVIDGTDRGQIVLTSDDPVLEPYLDFIIEARWPDGRLLREYTVLVDPPVFSEGTTVVSASEVVAASERRDAGGSSAPGADRAAPEPRQRAGADSRYGTGAPVAGGNYLVRQNDTLWEIASNARPEGVSVHQTMLDIQRLNPDAFIDGNINRIKAGYVIYLPASGDISSADLQQALAEVQAQNQVWREQRDVAPAAGGPALRITAGPDDPSGDTPDAAGGAASAAATPSGAGAADQTAAVREMMAVVEREREAVEQRLAAMEEQLRTLQDIVTLKDEQIAALQGALADASAVAAESVTAAPASSPDAAPQGAVAPVPAAPAVQTPAPADRGPLSGPIGWAVAGLAVLAGGLALLVLRRRSAAEDTSADAEDLFADIELQQEELEIDDSEEDTAPIPPIPDITEAAAPEPRVAAREPAAPVVADSPAPEQDIDLADAEGTRGYGERKHDEYASDVDPGDVLAEADIYVAYGRQAQAVELLNNAVANEPGNPQFHLKLVALHAEAGDMEAAREQYAQLQVIGDQPSLLEADRILRGDGGDDDDGELPLDLEIGDFNPPGHEGLDTDFAGLEIEDDSGGFSDDLDLSEDFDAQAAPLESAQGEDLVYAAEGNEMSTKLDLARAYIDMGDEEGARQILEEVAAEGSEEQRQEAGRLIQRLG